ncbi:MAG: nucleotide exchange factor GrpE [Methyloprofundus sp.]|nr:nucleotide exchange factor GrpE [Methyloprofundus sp.]MDT8426990.1 nucleotide exchange factor GrpE [Methyloprofundus sp.]
MSTEAQKNELLADFQKYLEQNNPDDFTLKQQPDLHSLLSEMTGLKTEVKAQARQFKNTLDTLSSALSTVQDDNKALAAELIVYEQRLEQQQEKLMRTMLLQMVDMYDRLNTGVEVLHHYQPVKRLFKKSRPKDVHFIERFKEGQLMTLKRFEQLLSEHQVRVIDCVGKRLDPVTMSAVETAQDVGQENGLVLQELRKGFLYKGQVLRLAEVKVNKINHG